MDRLAASPRHEGAPIGAPSSFTVHRSARRTALRFSNANDR